MSKSDEDKMNTIFLIDEDEIIQRKIMSSLTDNENKVYFDKIKKPGVSNLMIIYSSLKDISLEKAEEQLKDLNYKEFKEEVAKAIIDTIRPIREKFKVLNEKDIKDSLAINKEEVQKVALENLKKIEIRMGLKSEN